MPEQPPHRAGEQARRAATPEDLREQQAIAAAMLIGEESRREDRARRAWAIQRVGIFAAILSMMGLMILFAYSRIRQDFSPTFWMLVLAGAGAAGVVAAYWAYVEGRRG